MRILILAGGQGTRFSEETKTKPKSMIEVCGEPILWHLFTIFAKASTKELTILLGYKGDVIREYIANLGRCGSDLRFISADGKLSNTSEGKHAALNGLNIETLETGQDSFTGERIKIAMSKYDDDEFIVTYGDGLSNINIDELIAFHRGHGKLATVTAVRPIARFGQLDLGADGSVLKFEEKNQTNDGWINGGFFVLNKKVAEFIEGNEPFEGRPLQKLSEIGELHAFTHDGFWRPIDNLNDKLNVEKMIEQGGIIPWLV